MDMTQKSSKNKKHKIFLYLLPLLVSVGLMAYLKTGTPYSQLVGEMPSPTENGMLFNSLIIFTIGYLLFLGMIFMDDIRQMFTRKRVPEQNR